MIMIIMIIMINGRRCSVWWRKVVIWNRFFFCFLVRQKKSLYICIKLNAATAVLIFFIRPATCRYRLSIHFEFISFFTVWPNWSLVMKRRRSRRGPLFKDWPSLGFFFCYGLICLSINAKKKQQRPNTLCLWSSIDEHLLLFRFFFFFSYISTLTMLAICSTWSMAIIIVCLLCVCVWKSKVFFLV